MLAIILPTTPIVKGFSQYENLFCFYDDGVKGVVKDHVLVSRSCLVSFYEDIQKTDKSVRLMDEIIQKYETSLHRQYMENTYNGCKPIHMLEDIINEIEREVNNMMYLYFFEHPYSIERGVKWVGDDLIIKIDAVGETYGTPRCHH